MELVLDDGQVLEEARVGAGGFHGVMMGMEWAEIGWG